MTMSARMRLTITIRRLVFPARPGPASSNYCHARKIGQGILRSESERPCNSTRTLLPTQAEQGSSVGNLCSSDTLGRVFFRSGSESDGQIFSRYFAAQASSDTYTEEVDDINFKFAEARDDIEMALESKETVYFDAEAETARASVKAVLDKYESLLARLDERNKGIVQRSMGLKMEQLKAELKQLDLDREE
eukprot:TRINITY_DN17999_c0_g1_i1.p1 TRINITY_DN17999_c0_g1~~TRINITY_DN17999_c0_g1_i1.p1  ORF type:complete len:191 (+),score=34.83 TRINITY_DN17999_c0_g1_i1:63-635(+)